MAIMACSIACLKSSVAPAVCCNTALLSRGNYSDTLKLEFTTVKHSFSERRRTTLRSKFEYYFSSPCRRASSVSLRASSSSSWVDEDEATVVENGFEGSPEGSSTEDSKADIMKEVMQRLSEEDLEEAAQKYNYEEELFAQVDFAQINAFTNKPFSGNPAAVCYLPYDRDGNWLQLIAKEFNLPATAFVVKQRSSKKNQRAGDQFDIRWFSTTAELEICGHGTLASAHMLFSSGVVEGDTIIFHSKTGSLQARKVAGYDDPENPSEEKNEEDPEARQRTKVELGKGVVELDFPLSVVTQVDFSEAQSVQDALGGVEAIWVGRTAIGDYLDPVCGSAHCALGPYWATKLGKDSLQAYQASPRGGELGVRVDFGNGRVYLQGGAVLLMAGTLLNTFRT